MFLSFEIKLFGAPDRNCLTQRSDAPHTMVRPTNLCTEIEKKERKQWMLDSFLMPTFIHFFKKTILLHLYTKLPKLVYAFPLQLLSLLLRNFKFIQFYLFFFSFFEMLGKFPTSMQLMKRLVCKLKCTKQRKQNNLKNHIVDKRNTGILLHCII